MTLPNTVIMDLPTTKVSGCAVIREDGTYLAVINSRCGCRKQRMSAEHELRHIEEDDFGKEAADQIELAAHND